MVIPWPRSATSQTGPISASRRTRWLNVNSKAQALSIAMRTAARSGLCIRARTPQAYALPVNVLLCNPDMWPTWTPDAFCSFCVWKCLSVRVYVFKAVAG